MVWDGLRPDSVNSFDTPNLAALAERGTTFADNHSSYPTFTMMNAAALATGAFPGTSAFYGNTLWQPGAKGKDASGTNVDFQQPAYLEDWSILAALDDYYQGELFLTGTLFESAHAVGLRTAAIGKSGAAYLQDHHLGGVVLDEKMAMPLDFARDLQRAGFKLPKTTPVAHAAGAIALAADNQDPTAAGPKKVLADGVSSDPSDASGTPYETANAYMMNVFLDYVLPVEDPQLSFVWFRNPDSTQHTYGVGTSNAFDALRAQDEQLGLLEQRLAQLGLDSDTDIIVVSDHAHSNVAGSAELFPLRGIENGGAGEIDPDGYSVSGDVRLADLMTRAGFTAYDGSGCVSSPLLSGITAAGKHVYPLLTDVDGHVCGTVNKTYNTGSFRVPTTLSSDAVVIAANGGSEYLYVPSHDQDLIERVVRFLQSRVEFGAVFVGSQYGALPGTLPLDLIRVESARSPDIIVSYDYDDQAYVQGYPGTEYESMFNNRGMHGSFSPIDVHNTLIAAGPDFVAGFVDPLPSANIDVAPTVARILGLELPGADGRPLAEALGRGRPLETFSVAEVDVFPNDFAENLTIAGPTDPDGGDFDLTKSSYVPVLHAKILDRGNAASVYFDYAKAYRQ